MFCVSDPPPTVYSHIVFKATKFQFRNHLFKNLFQKKFFVEIPIFEYFMLNKVYLSIFVQLLKHSATWN